MPATSKIKQKTRSGDIVKYINDQEYREESEFTPGTKLKSGAFVIGRLLFLTKPEKGKEQLSTEDCVKIVAEEIHLDWIQKNVYPLKLQKISA